MCTWEPAANLIKYGCTDMVQEFEESLKPGAYYCYLNKHVVNKEVSDLDVVRELFRR